MRVAADNLYCFKNFEIDFSYKYKKPTSLIEFEYLEEYPNFKFKKLNVFIGGNASGKTVFGKLIENIFQMIENKDSKILENIAIIEKKAVFSIDFVIKKNKYILYRLTCEIANKVVKSMEIQSVTINKRDSYKKLTESLETIVKLENKENEFLTTDMMKELKKINYDINCLFCFTDEITTNKNVIKYDINVLNTVLKVFDSSIKSITKVEGTEDGYLIAFNHGKKLLLQNGKTVGGDILSSGTKEGLSIAYIISEIKKNPNRLFYVDEKFSHVHTDIEQVVLSVMIEILGKESQLFFTTHNLDILEMNIPIHSFTFFANRNNEVKAIYPENRAKAQNDRNLRNKAENDFFETVPDCSLLFNLTDFGDTNE